MSVCCRSWEALRDEEPAVTRFKAPHPNASSSCPTTFTSSGPGGFVSECGEMGRWWSDEGRGLGGKWETGREREIKSSGERLARPCVRLRIQYLWTHVYPAHRGLKATSAAASSALQGAVTSGPNPHWLLVSRGIVDIQKKHYQKECTFLFCISCSSFKPK